MEQQVNEKTLEKLQSNYDTSKFIEAFEKLNEIYDLLGNKDNRDGVEVSLLSLWSKSTSLINDSPLKTNDYHSEITIHDLAFHIKDALEDIQMLTEDIAKIVEPLINLDPESDVDEEDFDDEDEDEEDLDLDEFDDEDEDDEFDDEDEED